MFEIKIYETPAGNRPFEKYIEKLLKQHKEDEVYELRAYLNKLKEFGYKINEEFKPLAIKLLREDIYELRPSSSRVFSFILGMVFLLFYMATKKNKIKQIQKK